MHTLSLSLSPYLPFSANSILIKVSTSYIMFEERKIRTFQFKLKITIKVPATDDVAMTPWIGHHSRK